MSVDKAVSMEPVKEKLKDLRKYIPNYDDFSYDFAAYLADRLHPKLVPAGFCVVAESTLSDLQRGLDGYTREPIKNNLVNLSSITYAILRRQIPEIAEAVCPGDFAESVRDCWKKINAK